MAPAVDPRPRRVPPWIRTRFLEEFRFSGDVDAVPEGTPVFGQEPLLEIAAPLPEAQLVEGAPIDAFGVGTALGVSDDAPGLDMAYKLVHYDGQDRLKLSEGKVLLPGKKQVFRVETGGEASRDVLARREERGPGRPLLRPVMRAGRRLPEGRVALPEARAHAARELSALPPRLRRLGAALPPYPVEISQELGAARDRAIRERRPS
jgi:nicotinate phosphoribosyltransferase